ncbi:MAG: sugar phosphate isomerase/epimerase family protein [Phycisphaerae bacterium]
MKLGFNLLLWTTHVTDEHAPIFELLKANGYDGVEVPVMEGPVEHYEKLGRLIRSAGLECTSSTALPGPQANPISDDPAIHNAGLDYLKRCIDSVAALGSTVLCGPTYQTLGQFTGSGPTDDERQRIVEVHRAAADHAATCGVTLATEPLNRFECYFLNTLADAAEHTRAVDRPNFGVLFDTFHANIEEQDMLASVRRHGDVVRHVHLSENDRGIPGTGHVDFPGVIKTLREVDYDGWLVVEAFGRALPSLAAATCVWRDLFDSPEQVVEQSASMIRAWLA